MELTITLENLQSAKSTKDVFGELTGNKEEQLKELKQIFRQLAKATHEDLFPNDEKPKAKLAFQELNKWNTIAINEIENNCYGIEKQVVVSFKKSTYHLSKIFKSGDLADLYLATEPNKNNNLIFKLAKAPTVNELIKNEAKTLIHLSTYDGKSKNLIKNHIINLINSFEVNGRHGNLFDLKKDYYSLEQVIEAYPDGIDARNFAWIFRRLLSSIIGVHTAGYVHGAVNPAHFMINPKDHNGILVDFCYSVKIGEKIKTLVPKYKSWYPAEVLTKEPIDQKTDIYMAGRTMERLLGKKSRTEAYPKSVPRSIQNFLASCLIQNFNRRPNNSFDIYKEFDILIQDLWGKPKWVDFKMPS